MDATNTTVITVVGQIGALVGAMTIGWISTAVGRRLTMMTAVVCGGALIPAYILPRNMSLVATAFCEQFFVGGAWGPIPIHLIELSPPTLRSLLVGLTYQMGNLASSASATIQSTIGERYPLPPSATGEKRFDYGRVIGIFMGGVWAYDFLFLFLGPEMSQREREEEAEKALAYEDARRRGMSLQEIGEGRARGMDKLEIEEAEGAARGPRKELKDEEKGVEVEHLEG